MTYTDEMVEGAADSFSGSLLDAAGSMTFDEWYSYAISHGMSSGLPKELLERIFNVLKARAQADQTGDYQNVLQTAADNDVEFSPNQEKALDNAISNQRTEEARDYETGMRDTSLLSAADQLRQLGLSTSNVINTGGVSAGSVGAANNAMTNHSANMALAKYQQRMQMAKSVVGLAGQMASSGIYGTALGAARSSAAMLSSAAAHSGVAALKSWSGKGNGTFGQDSSFMKQWNNLPGAY